MNVVAPIAEELSPSAVFSPRIVTASHFGPHGTYFSIMKRMEKTSLDNVNTVHQLANLFWKLNKFRQTLMCSLCVTQSVTITFSESLFQTICQRSDFIVHQSWFVFCFHLILKKTAPFSVNKRKSFNLPFTL